MPKIALIVMTNGRKEYIEKTIASAAEMLPYPFVVRYIVDDSADSNYVSWIRERFGSDFEILPTHESLGFCGSIQRAWDNLRECELDYSIHCEEDFTFNEPIKIENMIQILNRNPHLAQVALLRQPCNPPEEAAGGVIQLYPDDFHEKSDGDLVWTEHARFFTTNVCLYPRHIINIPYPQEAFCEGKFSIKLREMGYRFAYLGRKDQKPKIHHIGHKRGKNWKWA